MRHHSQIAMPVALTRSVSARPTRLAISAAARIEGAARESRLIGSFCPLRTAQPLKPFIWLQGGCESLCMCDLWRWVLEGWATADCAGVTPAQHCACAG